MIDNNIIKFTRKIKPGSLWQTWDALKFCFSDKEIEITIHKYEILMFLQIVEDPSDFCYVRIDFIYKNKVVFWFFDKNPNMDRYFRVMEEI